MAALSMRQYTGFAVAFLGAPIVGSLIGASVMSWILPGEAAMFGVIYAFFGGIVALISTLFIGLPAFYIMAKRGIPLMPSFVIFSVCIGQIIALAIPCALAMNQCCQSLLHNHIYAFVASAVTAFLIVKAATEVQ